MLICALLCLCVWVQFEEEDVEEGDEEVGYINLH